MHFLLTYIVLKKKKHMNSLSQTRHEDMLTMILERRLTHFPHHPAINLHFFKQRKHPNSNSEVSAESRANAFCANVCWWMMPRRRIGRQGFVFLCSLSLCGFSSQHHRVWTINLVKPHLTLNVIPRRMT